MNEIALESGNGVNVCFIKKYKKNLLQHQYLKVFKLLKV